MANSSRMGTVLVCAIALGLNGSALADPLTVQFDLTEASMGFFGLEYTADYGVPVEDVRDMEVADTRLHLEFDTQDPVRDFPDAAYLTIQMQWPIVHIERVLTVSGADLSWSGQGQFTGDFESDYLNDALLDFPPGPGLSLWFVRVLSENPSDPLLGGHFRNSYIEVDLVPEPGALGLLAVAGLLGIRRR